MARIGITSFAYIPISAATSSQETKRLYEKAEADVEKQKKALGDKIPPGLEEQLGLQLKTLKDDTLPDLEFIAFPGFFTTESEYIIICETLCLGLTMYDDTAAPESGKSYVTILIVLNHPFSRGTIVGSRLLRRTTRITLTRCLVFSMRSQRIRWTSRR